MSQQASANLAQFRSELQLVIDALHQMRALASGGIQSGGQMESGGNVPYQSGLGWGALTVDKHLAPVPTLEAWGTGGGEDVNKSWAQADWANFGLPSKGAEDAFSKAMTRRRWVAFAGQINAMTSIFMRGAGVDQEVAQNITGGISNVISSVSWIYTAATLLSYSAGPAMVVMGTALLAYSWIQYFQKLTEMDPIYQMGGNSKAHVINGQVMYN